MMRFLILSLLFLLPAIANANYKVDPSGDSCGEGTTCKFDTKKICEKFLDTWHKSRPLSDCIVDSEVAVKKAQEEASKTERQELKAMIQTIRDYDKSCVNAAGNDVKLQPAWLKRLRVQLLKDMRD